MASKILDYGRQNPFGEIFGRPSALAWPVHAYRVTLPKASSEGDGLNAFERVIFKLLDSVGRMSERALADETRIPLDLVKGILLRLRDKGFINEHNGIVKRGENGSESKAAGAPVFATALVFRELVTGKLLPFMHLLDDCNPLRKREDERSVKIVPENPACRQLMPTPQDVIRVLRDMKKRSSAFGRSDGPPAVLQISIAQSPESYFLDCPIAIQKSDGEFRIADPFGNGFSLILETAFSQLLAQESKMESWFLQWKESLRNPRSSKRDSVEDRPKEPFETDANWQRYPKLVASLRPSKNAAFRSISKIHASIEWALFYACCRRPYEDAIAELRLTAQLEHASLLECAAGTIGLEVPRVGFRAVPEGKIVGFQQGQAELGTLLAIALLQAKRDCTHPLRRIARLHHDLIGRLFEIKRQRDENSHGKGGADSPNAELTAETFMRELVHALVPDIRFADTSAPGADTEARADSILDARASIQGEFGFKAFNRLGVNLQDRLIYAERFWLASKDGDDALAFVCDLYAALQAKFRQILSGRLPPQVWDSEFIPVAQARTQQYNLGELSECLCTVKPLAIRQTLQGSDPTLGACVVGFLLMAEEGALHCIANLQPTFIEDISRIITLRGHGNEPQSLPRADVASIRKSAYTTIKTLQEI